MIITNFSTFRWQFSEHSHSVISATFTSTTPGLIQRASGDFLAEGAQDGMYAAVANAANDENNGRFLIDSVAVDILTLDVAHLLVAEGVTAGVVIDCAFYDADGLPTWPLALVRSGGFDGGLTGVPAWYEGTKITVTCNAGAADAVLGTDEFDWYLSQRTDDPTKQYLSITQKPTSGGNSFSGSVEILHTALATSHLGAVYEPRVVSEIMKHVHLYARRRSDGAIQWINLHKAFATS